MVLKHFRVVLFVEYGFESIVILDGTQTGNAARSLLQLFESSVILDGTQTAAADVSLRNEFESSVILDGTQTDTAPEDTSKLV